MPSHESFFPFEVVVQGIPVSLQNKGKGSLRDKWRQSVKVAALKRRTETSQFGWLDARPPALRIYYFRRDPMQGDIDNIIKPIMDALRRAKRFCLVRSCKPSL